MAGASMSGNALRTALRSRGYTTDLMLAGFDGSITCHSKYVVVRTPTSPGFWWGNFVLFREAPVVGQRQEWEQIFDREIGAQPGICHRNLAWDVIDGSVGAAAEFVAAGYALTQNIFLSTSRARRAAHHNLDVAIRSIATDREWADALAIQHASLTVEQDTPSFRDFQTAQMVRARRMTQAGLGRWFGAFLGDRQVASMGLFGEGGLGRTQAVSTASDYRRQGICSAMVFEVCQFGLTQMGLREIVLMTGVDNAAARVYRSVGFTDLERVASVSISTGV